MKTSEVYDLIDNGDLEKIKFYVENCKVEIYDSDVNLRFAVRENTGVSMSLTNLITLHFKYDDRDAILLYLIQTFSNEIQELITKDKFDDGVMKKLKKTIKKLELLKSV